MTQKTPSVVVTGEYFCDLIVGRIERLPEAGREVFGDSFQMMPGGTFNIAAGLARAGVSTAWACEFGTDFFSDYVRIKAVEMGILPDAFQKTERDMTRVSLGFVHDDDRGFISSSLEPVRPAPFDELAPQWVIQSFRFNTDWIESAQKARARGAKIFCDARDCDATIYDPEVRRLLDVVDVFAPNESEALRLTKRATVEGAADDLAKIIPTVIITRGKKGAIYASSSERGVVRSPAIETVDTIGAGDAFNCGFIVGALVGASLAESVTAGCLFGACAATRVGGGNPADGEALLRFAQQHNYTISKQILEHLRGSQFTQHSMN